MRTLLFISAAVALIASSVLAHADSKSWISEDYIPQGSYHATVVRLTPGTNVIAVAEDNLGSAPVSCILADMDGYFLSGQIAQKGSCVVNRTVQANETVVLMVQNDDRSPHSYNIVWQN